MAKDPEVVAAFRKAADMWPDRPSRTFWRTARRVLLTEADSYGESAPGRALRAVANEWPATVSTVTWAEVRWRLLEHAQS